MDLTKGDKVPSQSKSPSFMSDLNKVKQVRGGVNVDLIYNIIIYEDEDEYMMNQFDRVRINK